MLTCYQCKQWNQISVTSPLKRKGVPLIFNNKEIMSNDQIQESLSREANLRLVIQAINVRGMQQAQIIPEEMIKVLKITTEELEFLL
jgi:isopentenyl phosphate kinase